MESDLADNEVEQSFLSTVWDTASRFNKLAGAVIAKAGTSVLALPGDLVDGADLASEWAFGKSLVETSWGDGMRREMRGFIGLPEAMAEFSEAERAVVDKLAFGAELATILVPFAGWAKGGAMAGRGARLLSVTEGMQVGVRGADEVLRVLPNGVREISLLDRIALNRAKIGIVAGGGVSAAIVTEFASGGAVSSVAAHTMLKVADAVSALSPDLAHAIKEDGLAVLAFGADLYDTPRDAAVNAGAIVLEENGHASAAAALRIANKISSPSLYVDILAAEEGERAERFIEKLCAASGVERDQLEAYLREHPRQRALIEEQLGTSFAGAFPGIASETPIVQSHERQVVGDGVEGTPDWVRRLGGNNLKRTFNDVVQNKGLHLFSSLNMFLAVLCSWLNWNGAAEYFKRLVVTEATMNRLDGDQNVITVAPSQEVDAGRGTVLAPRRT